MPIIQESDEAVRQAAEWLNQGKLIIYPTDTAYGIGADAENPEAIEKIFDIKSRFSNI
jgi:L-threonylcarbamoyladenylate synthase